MNQWLNRFLPETHNKATDSVDNVTTPSILSVVAPCDIDTMATVSVSNRHFDKTYYTDFFEERAGIAEFDGCQTKQEAEAIAYKDTVYEWIYNNPPLGCTIYNCVYCNHTFDFSKDGIIAVGEIYCCYHSEDSDHLKPYLESRTKEAKESLKNIIGDINHA